jgi:hypothetical protein
VPLVSCFRYPRSLGSIFVMPSIGSNFFGKARGAWGNLLEKQFLLFLYTLFLLSLSSYLRDSMNSSSHFPFWNRNIFYTLKFGDKLFPQTFFLVGRSIMFQLMSTLFRKYLIFDENNIKVRYCNILQFASMKMFFGIKNLSSLWTIQNKFNENRGGWLSLVWD